MSYAMHCWTPSTYLQPRRRRAGRDHRRAPTAPRACIADADSDSNELDLSELVKCFRLCLDCADVGAATVRVTSRRTEYDANLTKSLLEVCAATCKSCGDEWERHTQGRSTAGSAPRPAGAASRPAGNSWPP